MTLILDTNTRRTIVERTHGWEGASASLLAKVFNTTPQHVTSIASDRCAGCGKAICGCTDDAWRGVAAWPRSILGTILCALISRGKMDSERRQHGASDRDPLGSGGGSQGGTNIDHSTLV